MKRRLLLLFSVFLSYFPAHAQEYNWGVNFDYFFDNTEYGKSSHMDSETMNGIWIAPIGSIIWDNRHSVNAGVNLLKIPGMEMVIDKAHVTMYYQYKTDKILFRAGSFSRRDVLGNYNNFFFKDSVNNFMPLMQGIFWQMGNNDNFFNAWFDRTGYATPTKREHFFVGLSGKFSRGLFFADFQSYMFHYSNTRPSTPGLGVSENLQMQASVGLQYAHQNSLLGLISVGTLLGYERDRRFENEFYKPVGFVMRGDLEYAGIGTRNILYVGDNRQRLADTSGSELYWGTQFLREKFYLENEWYIRLIESERIKARFNCNLHFSEGNVMFQQMLTVSASIGNSIGNSKIVYPWMEIFGL